MKEQTLSIIKPDAVRNNNIGKIIDIFESKGLKIVEMKKLQLTSERAKAFYFIHRSRPFYDSLVSFISSGPVVVMVLEGDSAIVKNRELMGATNPAEAEPGTIRKLFASSIEENAVHGSDSPETAEEEIEFFFPKA
jgi:nucleoside-diphosphate kinase